MVTSLYLIIDRRWKIEAPALETLGVMRPQAGAREMAQNCPVRFDPRAFEPEDLLHGDDFAFHARDLGYRHHASRPVLQTRHLHDQVHADPIWLRTAFKGISIPAIATMFSRRLTPSRAELAWIVVIEPS